jgi:hypothetical protein
MGVSNLEAKIILFSIAPTLNNPEWGRAIYFTVLENIPGRKLSLTNISINLTANKIN